MARPRNVDNAPGNNCRRRNAHGVIHVGYVKDIVMEAYGSICSTEPSTRTDLREVADELQQSADAVV
jgi:hypothetical protein